MDNLRLHEASARKPSTPESRPAPPAAPSESVAPASPRSDSSWLVPPKVAIGHPRPVTKIYAVAVGRQVGVFDNWPDTASYVNGFKRAVFQSFSPHDADKAREFVRIGQLHYAMGRPIDARIVSDLVSASSPARRPPSYEEHPADVPDEDDLDFMSSASPLDDEIHYLVARGRVPGVYHHSKYREQIRDFPNGFAEVHPNKSAATAAWEAMCQDEPELPLGRDPEPTCGF